MQDNISIDGISEPRHLLMERLREKQVTILLNSKVKEILDDGVIYEKDGKDEEIHGAGCVALAVGVKSLNTLSEAIKDKVAEVHVIGDAGMSAKLVQATAAGAEIGRRI